MGDVNDRVQLHYDVSSGKTEPLWDKTRPPLSSHPLAVRMNFAFLTQLFAKAPVLVSDFYWLLPSLS